MANLDQVESHEDHNDAALLEAVRQLTRERDRLSKELEVLYSSRSWTLTAPLRRAMSSARRRAGRDSAPPEAFLLDLDDLPPGELRARVTGAEDPDWFRSSGEMALEDIAAALAVVGRSLADFERIYDFGCGCGRISLPLTATAEPAQLTATDADGDATAWLAERLPAARIEANGDLPPLPFADDSFDLIIGWSVVTHLPEDYQDAWLAELARVLSPGGTMLLTIHGPSHFELVDAPADDPNRVALKENGIVYFENYGPDSPFAPYYQTTYHHPDYVRDHWSQWLEVSAILPGAARPTHDMVITQSR